MTDIAQSTVANLNKRGFKAFFFEDKDAALDYLLAESANADIGIGGSMTVAELGWYDALCKSRTVFWHAKTPEVENIMQKANAAPCYITSANAISQKGDIVNIDANGNRVAGTAFGPKKLFYICGENKIAPSLEEAIYRAKNIAAPKNAKRLNRKTPCAINADKCYDCNSPERICRIMSITARPVNKVETHVVFIAGYWGY